MRNMAQKIVHVLLLGIMNLYMVAYGNTLAILGRECAEMHSLLQSKTFCNNDFLAFLNRIVEKQEQLSLQDWETICILTKQYVHRSIKEGNREQAIQVLNRLLMLVHAPKKIRKEFYQSCQRLNPNNLMLKDLLSQLYVDRSFMEAEDPLLRVYSMALYSNYESQKQAILFAKEQRNFTEALSLCNALLQNLEEGKCGAHPDLVDIERCFLDKTIITLRIEEAISNNKRYSLWLVPYFEAEEAYVHAIEALITRIANHEIERSQEVDEVLLSHALGKMVCKTSEAIKELNVLIGYGNYLYTTRAQYAYFSLLEIYYQQQNLDEIGRLLEYGRSVFVDNHTYEPEYMFFLGCYLYHNQKYEEAKQAFTVVLNHTARLGVTLARTYEYLGCLACYSHDYQEAKKFFLQAYKGWGAHDAQLGLFLVSAKLQDFQFCKTLLTYSSLAPVHSDVLKKMQAVFVSSTPETHSSVLQMIGLLNTTEEVSQESIYSRIIESMTAQSETDISRPILGFIHYEIQNKEKESLSLAIQSCQDNHIRRALLLWLAYMENQLPVVLARQAEDEYPLGHLESLLACCYDAVYLSKPKAIHTLPQFFSTQCSHLQSVLRLIWLQVRTKQHSHPQYFSDSLSVRMHGDRLYFFAYDTNDYLLRHDALDHLAAFPELFPHSSLLPVAHYFLGLRESSLLNKVHRFKKASEEFSMISIPSIHAKTWACIYYDLHLDLAEAYISLGQYERAIKIFEDLKEDWFAQTHPRLSVIPEGQYRCAIEKQWILGLARMYHQIGNLELLQQHIYDYLKHRWSFSKYLQEDVNNSLVSELKLLCQCFVE